mgnify:CR=1 FL=1
MIWLYEMKTPSYNKFKEWSEILETDTLGVMNVSYDEGNSQKYYDDQFYVDFNVILKPADFKNISNKLLNKKNDVEYDFYFDVEIFLCFVHYKDSYYHEICNYSSFQYLI